jgi:hypothetical protein
LFRDVSLSGNGEEPGEGNVGGEEKDRGVLGERPPPSEPVEGVRRRVPPVGEEVPRAGREGGLGVVVAFTWAFSIISWR